jgi:hypothetical protein
MVFEIAKPDMITKNKFSFKPLGNNKIGENYLLTYTLKNSIHVRLIINNSLKYPILHYIDSDKYYICQLRFNSTIYENNIEIYGSLLNNVMYIYAVNYNSKQLIKGLEALDQLLYSNYREDLVMENISLKFSEFLNTKSSFNKIKNLDSILYLNNNLNANHFIEKVK